MSIGELQDFTTLEYNYSLCSFNLNDMNENTLEDLFCLGSDETILNLIDEGIPLDIKVNYGTLSILHIAATRKTSVVVEKLLECGFDINEVGHDGYTPLHAAVEGRELPFLNRREAPTLEVVEFLLKKFANRNAQMFSDGSTPLHKYVEHKGETSVEGLRLLIEYGADPNIQMTSTGQTALHLLAKALNSEELTLERKETIEAMIDLLKTYEGSANLKYVRTCVS